MTPSTRSSRARSHRRYTLAAQGFELGRKARRLGRAFERIADNPDRLAPVQAVGNELVAGFFVAAPSGPFHLCRRPLFRSDLLHRRNVLLEVVPNALLDWLVRRVIKQI